MNERRGPRGTHLEDNDCRRVLLVPPPSLDLKAQSHVGHLLMGTRHETPQENQSRRLDKNAKRCTSRGFHGVDRTSSVGGLTPSSIRGQAHSCLRG